MRLGSGLDATAECEGRQGHFAYSARIDGDGSAVGAPRLESPRVEWGLGAVPLKWNFVSHGREGTLFHLSRTRLEHPLQLRVDASFRYE